MSKFEGKRVLVTGGGSGIGKIMACEAARRGAEVFIWDISGERAADVARIITEHGCKGHAYAVDVTSDERVAEAAAEVGNIDILINNAGVVSGRNLVDTTMESVDRTLNVNLRSLFVVTRAFLPGLLERDEGTIVNVASAAGIVGVAQMTDYCASKFGAFGFTEALRNELRVSGSNVNTLLVCPYYISTGMFDGVKTRFPLLLPIMRPAHVALRILDAIECDKEQLVMPPFAATVPWMRFLPTPIFDAVNDFFGVNRSMENFSGRDGDRV
ncbi:MAG: SDR family oxidoreductase [Propionibacteriaceae bacterium]|jgi:all-trans-retinol dehydrogenase (NAD+)|nr:SDR family oxidoreductase [Propionibacteriaceae bacterium]